MKANLQGISDITELVFFQVWGQTSRGYFLIVLHPLPSHQQQVQLSSQILFEQKTYHHFRRAGVGSGETLVPQSNLNYWSWKDVGLSGRQSRMGSMLLAFPSSLNSIECQKNIKGQIWKMEILWKGLKHAQRFYQQPLGVKHLTVCWTALKLSSIM